MSRFGVHEVSDLTLYNLVNKKAELFLDSLKLSNLENNADSSYAQGGSGSPRLVGWDFNRTVTLTAQDALLNPKAIAMQVGTDVEKKIETIYERFVTTSISDGGTPANSKISLPDIPDVGSIQIVESADGYGHDKDVDSASATITGKDVSIPTASLAVGKQVIVYYTYQSSVDAEVLTVKSDKFSGFYRAVGKTLWRNVATGKDEKVQIVLPKVKITSQFTLTMQPDGDPSVFDFNLDCFKDSSSTDMVKLVRYGVIA
jgi:hypothetical protein